MVCKARVFLLICLSVCALQGFSQISFDSQEELEKTANSFFETADYASAKPLFSQLLSKSALDPNYNYRFGVCMLYTEADPLKPLPYIEGGANSAGVNPEAFYFLGKAYQFNYRFDEAIEAYQKGKKAGLSNPRMDLERSIKECRNGKILYNGNIDFKPAMDKEVFANEFYRPYDFRKLKGKVIPMPPSFKTKFDEKNLQGAVVYTPTNSQTIVYASYGEDGASGKDLYRVNRLPNGELSLPLKLPNTINTKYDEDYAFYDEESQMLFFASTGHNTMGGYDVFSSKYNPNTSSWSTPVNLQYPISSPFDDFLYVSDPEGKLAFFTSGRNTDEGKLRVLKTLLYDPQQVEVSIIEGTFIDKTDSLYNYAALTVLDPITNEVVGKYRTHKQTGKYLLVLPPQSGYKMDVGPKEANGFKFGLDVPKTDAYHPLKQEVHYAQNGESGTVTVTNFFDSTGSVDTVVATESRPVLEVVEQMVDMPELPVAAAAEDLANQSKKEEEAAKAEAEQKRIEAELALAEKARQDSVKQAKIKEELALAAKLEEARQDSIQKAEQLAAKKQAEQDAADKALAAEKERIRLDSILNAQVLEELALVAEQEARQDSIQKAEQLAAKQKAEQDAADKALAAEKERVRLDSLLKEQELAELNQAAKLEEARQGSIQKAEQLAAKKQAEQEAAEKALAAEQEKIRLDSIAKVDELAAELKRKQDVASQAALVDSISEVDLALLAAAEQEVNPEEIEKQFLAEAREKAKQDSLREQEEFERLRASHLAARARRDSVNRAVELTESSKPIEQAAKDSAAAELAIEQQRLAQIEKEVELAKQQALADSLHVFETDVEVTMVESDKDTQLVVASVDVKEDAAANSDSQLDTLLTETEELSESQLFLETIAKLEAQKQEQKAEVEEENKKALEAKLETEKAAKTSLESSDSTFASNTEIDSPTDSTEVKMEELVSEAQTKLVQSDADPNAYLAQLNEIERKMAEEAASRPDKSYTLNTIETRAADKGDETLDPVLQAKIQADREALAEHRKMAEQKEQALREQMARDKSEVADLEATLSDELESVNSTEEVPEVVVDIEAKKATGKTKKEVAEEQVVVAEEVKENEESADAVVLEVEESTELEVVETKNEDVEAEVVEIENTEAEVSEEVLSAMKEFDAILDNQEEVVQDEPVRNEIAETEEVVANQEELVERKAETEVETLEVEELAEVEKVVASTNTEAVPGANSSTIEAETPSASTLVSVGQIPFITPALRDYSSRQPSFDNIQDKSLKRMVKRMRSEDIGRMAVLKNMKNQWVESGRSAQALREIKENKRNQDVLSSIEPSSREEVARPAFNRDDLKRRQNVFYKLELVVKTNDVSETIKETMNPEQAITFAMPEFKLTFDRFVTLADARSGYNEYKNKGFDKVKIISFLNNEPSTLSVVSSVPFVE